MDSLPRKLSYIPALDGIRGVAILLVVFYHASFTFFQVGYLGVDIFFALSGFLITTIIVTEHTRTGSVDLLAFYKRRALRLLPALFAVIAVALMLVYLFYTPDIQKETITQAFASSVYVSNWVQASRSFIANNPLAITWSLSVEDQFYILWTPVLVLALIRHVRKYRLIASVLLVSAVSALLCFVLIDPHEYSNRAFFGTDTRAQALLIGCVAGLLYSWAMVPATVRSKRILWMLCLPGPLFFLWATRETLVLEDYTSTLPAKK
jgi:peptidoglycan/LPS O-acetylase OafA/YrhL